MIVEDDGDAVCSTHGFRIAEDGVCPLCRREIIRRSIDLTCITIKELNQKLTVLEKRLFDVDELLKKL